MKKILLLAVVYTSILPHLTAQNIGDTITIESFNYSQTYGVNQWSPGIRDTIIDFSILPNQPIEKVLMLYNMRCKDNKVSNSSNRDQGCGEWDASCNTYFHDSTRIDSVMYTHPNYTISSFSGTTFEYTSQPVYDYYQYKQEVIEINSINNESSYQISNGTLTDSESLDGNQFSGKSQFLYTASELTSAGFTAGEINGLELQSSNTSSLHFFKIKIKETTLLELDPKTVDTSAFSEVFNNTYNFTSGANKIIFSTPFAWNGTDNIIIEFSFTNTKPTNSVQLFAESSTNNAIIANNGYSVDFSNNAYIEIPIDAISSISDEISISCWLYGKSDLLPSNTSIFEGDDEDGNRTFNVHLPWNNGNIYFDCGNEGSSYDRIEKEATNNHTEGQWNHWAFTKNTNTGAMKIYFNGDLWHSGTNKTKTLNISKIIVGNDTGLNYNYKGLMDELRIWNKELSQTEINNWKNIAIDNSHPNYNNLVAYYKMDEGSDTLLNDLSTNGLEASSTTSYFWKNIRGDKLNRFFKTHNKRPKLSLIKGDFDISISTITTTDSILLEPHLVHEYTINTNIGTLQDDEVDVVSENSYWSIVSTTYNGDTGEEISISNLESEDSISISDLEYFKRWPAKIEFMSFVTPYGLGLNLGEKGKTWTFDLTDFLPIFKGKKRMTMERGGQWMEDMDIKFLFILGTPPRDVIDFSQIWRPESRNYSHLENDRYFAPRETQLNPQGKFFKIRSSVTGHGQEGEFIARQHFININGGNSEFNWQVWKECAENPIYPQGGTWIYDRAGWCPGSPTDIQHFDITSLVSAGQNITIDYGVLNANGASKYIINNQLITYGEINHNLDASIVEVLEPSNRVEYSRFNSICHEPKIVIKNTGKTKLTSLVIKYWINNSSNPLTINWTGNLEFDETERINLPSPLSLWLPVNQSGNIFHVKVESPNGETDEYEYNDTYHSKFEIPEELPENIVIYFKTNNAGAESSYKIIDSDGNAIISRNSMLNNTIYRDTVKLEYGCYTFIVEDTGDDGIDFWANNDGLGVCRIFKGTGGLLKNFEGDFGNNINFEFTVGSPLSYEDIQNKEITIYPNPAQSAFTIEADDIQQSSITIYDNLVRKIDIPLRKSVDKIEFDSSFLKKGLYLIEIEHNGIIKTEKIIIQ